MFTDRRHRTPSVLRRAASLAIVASLAAAPGALAIPVGTGDPGDPPPGPPVNEVPDAAFTMTPNPALVAPNATTGQTVTLNPVGSSDIDGSIKKYEWDFDGDGTYTSSTTNPTVKLRRYAVAGTFNVRLRVTDNKNATSTATHALLVHSPPNAVLAATPPVALIGQQVTYSAAGSSDDNGPVSYAFDLDGDGSFETNTGATPTATTSYTTLGSRSVQVRVTDIHGATATKAIDQIVHRAPTASFLAAPSPATVGQSVTLDGSASTDDAPIAKYEWDLDGNGTYETDTLAVATTSTTFTTPGAVTLGLRVTDIHGVQDAVTRPLIVNAAAVIAPIAVNTAGPGAGAGAGRSVGMKRGARQLVLRSRSLKVGRTGRVAVKVSCPANAATCTGKLSLRREGKTIGSRSFMLASGRSATVRILISGKARTMVKRNRRLRVQAVATVTGAAATRAAATIR